jgi:hypothetical protein
MHTVVRLIILSYYYELVQPDMAKIICEIDLRDFWGYFHAFLSTGEARGQKNTSSECVNLVVDEARKFEVASILKHKCPCGFITTKR